MATSEQSTIIDFLKFLFRTPTHEEVERVAYGLTSPLRTAFKEPSIKKKEDKPKDNMTKDTMNMTQEQVKQKNELITLSKKSSKKKESSKPSVSNFDAKSAILNELLNILGHNKSPKESIFFQDINLRDKEIEQQFNNITQEMQVLTKHLADVSEKFNEAHTKLIGLFATMVGRTDLSKHVNEHLFDKMREVVLYYPPDVIPIALRKFVIGYFAGKQAGLDTDSYSNGELIAMGSHPEIVAKLSPKSLEVLGGIIDILPKVFESKVLPYKVQLDKLQMLARLYEVKQNHLAQEKLRLQHLEELRLQKLLTLYNILAREEEKKEALAIQRQRLLQKKSKETSSKPQEFKLDPDLIKKMLGK